MYAVGTIVCFRPNDTTIEDSEEVFTESEYKAIVKRVDENDESLPYYISMLDNENDDMWVSGEEVTIALADNSQLTIGLNDLQALLRKVESDNATISEIKDGLTSALTLIDIAARAESSRREHLPSGLCSMCFEQVEYEGEQWTHVHVNADHTPPAIILGGQE